jgi:hypothetical protein
MSTTTPFKRARSPSPPSARKQPSPVSSRPMATDYEASPVAISSHWAPRPGPLGNSLPPLASRWLPPHSSQQSHPYSAATQSLSKPPPPPPTPFAPPAYPSPDPSISSSSPSSSSLSNAQWYPTSTESSVFRKPQVSQPSSTPKHVYYASPPPPTAPLPTPPIASSSTYAPPVAVHAQLPEDSSGGVPVPSPEIPMETTKGAELGLDLSDFDILDTLGEARFSLF